MRKPVDAFAFSAMVVLCVIWGLQQVAIKVVVGDFDPALQIALRSGIGACLVLAFSRLWLRDSWLPGIAKGPGPVAGLLFGLEFLLVAEGLRWTNAAHMAVFLYTAPIFAALGLHLALPQEHLSRVKWIGIAIAFSGIGFIFLAPGLLSPVESVAGAAISHEMLIGDLMGLGAGFAWGMTTVTVRTTRLSEAPPAQTLFWQLAVGFIVAFAFVLMFDRTHFVSTGLVWTSLIFQTLIVVFISYLVWFRLLRVYLASRLGVLSFMTPLFGVLFGVVLLGERLEPSFIIGAALVLCGMLVVNGGEWRDARLSRKLAAKKSEAADF
ncbi:DMT family transporter [Pseudochelatococcus contaminans]|uniref:Drug/metabolite transporter (DMT)-like permease n=1 Tax=Pseudochelatococcus contaminans TaxID=1538103 RepID=A0A7W5Z4J0_9HYPH|nr:DMT family transporter [Pseudochelatococcus contaminans]MBB3809938.1 drug/metabolite transporter (DMT)-like permease [Pseudochelatococcus contaminans]